MQGSSQELQTNVLVIVESAILLQRVSEKVNIYTEKEAL